MKKLSFLLLWAFSFKATYSQSWAPLPGGSLNGSVTSMISFDGYRWFSGGFSNSVARHNGTNWVSTPPTTAPIRAFCVWNNVLYGAGSFPFGGNTYGAVKWNGTGWDYFGLITSESLSTLTVFNNQLVFGGRAPSIDGVPISHLAKWNGSTWSSFPFTITCSWAVLADIRAVETINNYLHVGGDISDINGVSSSLAFKTDGTSVIPLSLEPNYYVADFAKYHDSAFCTGNFPFGPFPANQGSPGIVKTNDVIWHQVEHGLKLRGLSMSASPVGLYIGGSYSNVCYNIPCNHADVGNLGMWDGTSWSNQSNGLFNQGNEVINFVYTDYSTNLTYAMGSFHTSQGDVADYIAVKTSYPLPVHLSLFTAQLSADNANTVLLRWRDETPDDQNLYEVQMSTDGTNFYKIGAVAGHSNVNDYSFVYPNKDCGKLFFRLHFENDYSQVRPITIPCLKPTLIFKQGQSLLMVNTPKPGQVKIFSSSAQMISSFSVSVGRTERPISGMVTGVYFVTFVSSSGDLITQKIMIQ